MALDGSHNSDLALKGAGARYHRISSNRQDFERQVDAIDRWLASHDLRADWTFGDTGARDLAEERFQFQAYRATPPPSSLGCRGSLGCRAHLAATRGRSSLKPPRAGWYLPSRRRRSGRGESDGGGQTRRPWSSLRSGSHRGSASAPDRCSPLRRSSGSEVLGMMRRGRSVSSRLGRAGQIDWAGRTSRLNCYMNCNSPVATRIATGLLVVSHLFSAT